MSYPLRIALVGAGIFARDAHVPALLELPESCEIVAIFSRTERSTAALNALLPKPVPEFHDLTEMLIRKDIEAVDILLPINNLPGAIKLALQAGKHVISEKPMAPTVKTGQDLLRFHQNFPQQVWMVAENYRFQETYERAAEIVASGEIGQPMFWNWPIFAGLKADNPYYQTEWRRAGDIPGGWFVDGGVHFMAAIRMILGEVVNVMAEARQMRADLKPVDTLSATMETQNGLIGSYAHTYAAGVPWTTSFTIVGSEGVLEVHSGALKLTKGGEVVEETTSTDRGVKRAITAFVEAVQGGVMDERGTPKEALRDIAVIEALMRSAATGKREAPEAIL